MFSLTHQERKVLIFIGILVLIGSILKILNDSREDLSLDRERVLISENSDFSRPININAASPGDLKRIPGIGEVIARRIIDYRNQFGSFKDLEDLKKVKGIGDKKIEAIKKHVAFN